MDRARLRKILPRVFLFLLCAYFLVYPGTDPQDHRFGALGIGVLLMDFFISRAVPRWARKQDPELEAVTKAALKLEKTDPAAATKLLDDYFMKAAETETRELADLKARAPSDGRAAKELVERLEDKLAINDRTRRNLKKRTQKDASLTPVLAQVEQDDVDVRRQLAEAQALLERARLSAS
jgi:hypothetical protein